jgi:hypothetical protein
LDPSLSISELNLSTEAEQSMLQDGAGSMILHQEFTSTLVNATLHLEEVAWIS